MKITVLCVGKLKEKYLVEGIKEYTKRMTPFAKVEIIEVADEPCPDNASQALEEKIRQKEADKLLKKLRPDTFLIILDLKGKMLSSEEMARKIQDLAISGKSDITFIIGGSIGLAPTLVQRANLLLSLSNLTFPHQLVRLLLMEQIYRWFKIIHNEPYHK
ncbi:23S rRNA (pseudouridine(1915)-N(3))-methyltransferase RlmH [Desulfotomaculum defluvii]